MKHMYKKIRKIFAVISAVAFVFLGGCDSNVEIYKDFPNKVGTVSSKEIASNNDLSLQYDNATQNIILQDNKTGKLWSAVENLETANSKKTEFNSPIYIEYINSKNLTKEIVNSLTGTSSNVRVASENIKNGIELVYYFDDLGISVPVSYTLRESSLAVTVDFNKTTERENKLLSVSIAPFFCSVKNNESNSYLFVPTGSGALMYPDERIDGGRNYSGYIYGSDPASLIPEDLNEEIDIRLPVYGVKNNTDVLFAIIEEGDNSAYITANAGNADIGYSNVYATFYARGFDVNDVSDNMTGSVRSDIYQVTEEIDNKKATTVFYLLSGDNASYIGMAEKYREYLQSKGFIKQKIEENPYALYITGGAQIKELFLGFPILKTKALTTFNRAKEIIDELSSETGSKMSVQLRGFGQSGLTVKKIAGGFDFSSAFGNDSDRQALEKYCLSHDISLFTDFDLINFSSTGNGYNTLTNTVKSAMHRKVKLYYKDKALWNYDKETDGYFLLNRSELDSAVEKLNKAINNKNISNVSLSTLGKTAYSDYSDIQYNARGQTVEDVQEYINQIKTNDVKVATESANAYAAVVSDSIFEVVTENGYYNAFDDVLPFYQMVFKGYVPLYSTSANTTDSFNKSVMLAVQSGTSLGFSVVGEYNSDFSSTPYVELFASDYSGSKQAIVDAVLKNKEYYSAINGQSITGYEFVSGDVTKTVFSNGVTVYANHSDKISDSPLGSLEPYGFSYSLEVVE